MAIATWRVRRAQGARSRQYRYRRLRKRIQSDPRAVSYVDESLWIVARSNATDEFVQVYADKIPKTYGSPGRRSALDTMRRHARHGTGRKDPL